MSFGVFVFRIFFGVFFWVFGGGLEWVWCGLCL